MTTDRPEAHQVDIRRDLRIPTADPGVTLSADLYVPRGTAPVPALVTVIPYRKDFIGRQQYDGPLRHFAAHGYACLLVDLRGTGSSDGVARPRLDPGEGDDAVAAIDWAARQSWCTGDVGMWGVSYAAAMTMRAAGRRPPQLKAIIPVVGKPDPERYDGDRGDGLLTGWGAQMLTQQLLPPLVHHHSPEEQRRWRRRLREAAPVVLDLARHGRGDPEWRDRVIDVAAITAPTLCVGGWRDCFPDSVVQLYAAVKGPKKLLMGPWMHSMPQESPYEPIDFLSMALRWWDHWLLGRDTGMMDEPPVTAYIMGDAPGWRACSSWPPPGNALTLATGPDTTLVPAGAAGPAPDTAIAKYRPDPTIGALAGLGGESPSIGLPLDQHDDDSRSLSATSGELRDGLLIAGVPEVTIETATGVPPERLVVRLCEVDEEGRSSLITYGRHRPRRTGRSHRVALNPIMYRLRPGHRVRVAVSDSDFPRLTPLPRPTPIDVSRITLSAPVCADDPGTAVALPVLTRATHPLNQQWTITRDPVNDELEVAVAHTFAGHLPGIDHHIERTSTNRTTVRCDAPEAARTTGGQTITVRLTEGTTVTVTSTVRCTQTSLWVRGEVVEDDVITYSRVWEASLGTSVSTSADDFSGEKENTQP
jgi:putative CocE/NonD family hydrolase